MIDRNLIGLELPQTTFDLERGRMKFFAKVIGATDPIYHDEAAARAAGHLDLPALPTFVFAAELDTGSLSTMLERLGVDIGRILHGEQSFAYRSMAYAGDRLSVSSRVADIYDKKNGALEFIVKATRATNQRGEPVANMRSVIVVRN
jgi:acyl dehydratase